MDKHEWLGIANVVGYTFLYALATTIVMDAVQWRMVVGAPLILGTIPLGWWLGGRLFTHISGASNGK